MPEHNQRRRVPLSPRLLAVLAVLPRRGLWVIAADDSGITAHHRAGGPLGYDIAGGRTWEQ